MSIGGLWGALRGWIGRVWRSLTGWLGQYVREIHVYGGLCAIGYGLWAVWQPLAWLAVGAGLVVIGLRYVRTMEAEQAGER